MGNKCSPPKARQEPKQSTSHWATNSTDLISCYGRDYKFFPILKYPKLLFPLPTALTSLSMRHIPRQGNKDEKNAKALACRNAGSSSANKRTIKKKTTSGSRSIYPIREVVPWYQKRYRSKDCGETVFQTLFFEHKNYANTDRAGPPLFGQQMQNPFFNLILSGGLQPSQGFICIPRTVQQPSQQLADQPFPPFRPLPPTQTYSSVQPTVRPVAPVPQVSPPSFAPQLSPIRPMETEAGPVQAAPDTIIIRRKKRPKKRRSSKKIIYIGPPQELQPVPAVQMMDSGSRVVELIPPDKIIYEQVQVGYQTEKTVIQPPIQQVCIPTQKFMVIDVGADDVPCSGACSIIDAEQAVQLALCDSNFRISTCGNGNVQDVLGKIAVSMAEGEGSSMEQLLNNGNQVSVNV